MNLKEDGVVGAPTNTTAGVEGPKAPIKAKQKNLFKRVTDIKKKNKERSVSVYP